MSIESLSNAFFDTWHYIVCFFAGVLNFLQRSAFERIIRWFLIDVISAVLVGSAVYFLAVDQGFNTGWIFVYVIVGAHNGSRIIGIVSTILIKKWTDKLDVLH